MFCLNSINYALQIYPVQAPLHVSANAHVLAFLAFMRSFAGIDPFFSLINSETDIVFI